LGPLFYGLFERGNLVNNELPDLFLTIDFVVGLPTFLTFQASENMSLSVARWVTFFYFCTSYTSLKHFPLINKHTYLGNLITKKYFE